MSVVKDITILAVTKMHGGVCTAGIDSASHWVRPVRAAVARPRNHDAITDHCLLPVDFFHGGRSQLVNLGVTRFWLTAHDPEPPHTEDWVIDTHRKPHFLHKLSEAEQEKFLAAYAHNNLDLLQPVAPHSLGLFLPDNYLFTFSQSKTGEDVIVRASFSVAGQQIHDVGCTDLRLRALGRKLLERSHGATCTLSDEDFHRHGKRATYLAVGLSRLFHGKHWLLVVGVHTIPELEVQVDYARL
ncbi:MAG TPA: hypothetical protein VNQ79_22025 [Blastocatellia bacterium]|nr:hypothetical protein [Blastocatellia bacterium]